MSKAIAARAGAWSALDLLLRQGVQFVVSIILARLLVPADFGLIALLTFFTSLSIMFVQGGLALALVQRQETTREEESAVFWVNLMAGLIFATIIILIAPAAARFYEQPLLRSLMFVAAAQVVVSAIGAVHGELLTRTLQFNQIAKTGLISSLMSAIAGVTTAVMGLGVWALAIQMLTQAVTGTAALWWISPWRPQMRFRLSAIRGLYGFGAFISLSSVLEVVYSNGFALLIGKFHGTHDLGLFNRAIATQAFPSTIFSGIISRVGLPLFSTRKDDPDALQRGLRASLRLTMLLSLPIVVGLALLSDLILLCLYGPPWVPAARVLTILCFAGALLPFHVLNLQFLLALGRSREYLEIEIKKKVFGIAAVFIGSLYGIEGLAYAVAVANIPTLFINAAPAHRILRYGAMSQLYDCKDIIAAAAFMGGAVLIARSLTSFSPWPELLLLVSVGGIAYLAFGFGLRLGSFKETFQTIRLMLSQKIPA